MPDNRLQIIAEMVDKVSPAAKKMQAAFDNLNKAASKDFPAAFKKYQAAVSQNEKALASFGRRSEGVRREIKAFQDVVVRTAPVIGRMTESIGAFTTGTGSAIGAVAAVGAALVVAGKSAIDFAAKMKEIKFGSQESGLGKLQLTQLTQALGEFNISQEETAAGFRNLRAAMTEASTDTGKFVDKIVKDLGPAGVQLAAPVIEMIRAGKSTAEVYGKISEQVEKIKKTFPGAKGEDLAGRFVQEFGLSEKFGRVGTAELKEKLAVIERLGSTGAEMKEAAEQAELLNKKLAEGKIILDHWKLLLGTDITKAFLGINTLLDKIDAKYNKFFSGGFFRKLIGPNTYDQMFPPTFNERFGGEAASGGGGSSYVPPGGSTPGGSSTQPGASGGGGGGGPAPGAFGGAPSAAPGGGSFAPRAVPSGAGVGGVGDPRGLTGYIRQQAIANGVDPDVAVRVARSEGLANPIGDHGKSFGAFQLYTGGGLGNEFQKETGLNPADPANEKATIDFAMKRAAKGGWGPWHGAAHVGIGRMQGIPSAAAPGAVPPAGTPGGSGGPAGAIMPGAETAVGGGPPAAFIVHHTGGRGDVAGVQSTLRQRGLGVEYVMDRDGNIVHTGGPGSANILPGWGAGKGLTNKNIVGMEVIAKNDRDVLPVQVEALKAFAAKNYPNTPFYGHGEVNPGHKEADEGMTIVSAIRAQRAAAASYNASSRQSLNAALSGAPATVHGTGKLDVNVNAAVGKTARSQGIFKNINQERSQQMTPANSGPVQQSLPMGGL